MVEWFLLGLFGKFGEIWLCKGLLQGVEDGITRILEDDFGKSKRVYDYLIISRD